MNYPFWKLLAGVLCTIALYSVLYKENKLYRLFEHIFLGLAAGFSMYALWTETLKASWWDKMFGSHSATSVDVGNVPGYWGYAFLLPIGLMGYFVFSKKHSWMSRVPIGIILGLWSGQQLSAWLNEYGPQISKSLNPIVPTSFASFGKPATAGLDPAEIARINATVYPSQAISNLIFIFTLLCVLSYFLYSFDAKNKGLRFMSTSGRWLLMIGFGAIFGSTVMMRFTLLIDRMYFVWIEFFKQGLLHMK